MFPLKLRSWTELYLFEAYWVLNIGITFLAELFPAQPSKEPISGYRLRVVSFKVSMHKRESLL